MDHKLPRPKKKHRPKVKNQPKLFKAPYEGGIDLELGSKNIKDESRNETPGNSSDLPCIFKSKENIANK